ncbi:MAG: GNAT family N-acetyltransferase [Tetrasphaera sp.]
MVDGSPKLSDGRYVGLLVHLDGQVVGGVGILWQDLPPNMNTTKSIRGYLLNMYVDPVHRSQGIARILPAAALDACRTKGVDVVTLHASDAGRAIYAAAGFTSTSEMRLQLD